MSKLRLPQIDTDLLSFKRDLDKKIVSIDSDSIVTLTVSSNRRRRIASGIGQYVLPLFSTLVSGDFFEIDNPTSGAVNISTDVADGGVDLFATGPNLKYFIRYNGSSFEWWTSILDMLNIYYVGGQLNVPNLRLQGAEASRIAGLDGNQQVISLPTTLYPTLDELQNLKAGKSSSIKYFFSSVESYLEFWGTVSTAKSQNKYYVEDEVTISAGIGTTLSTMATFVTELGFPNITRLPKGKYKISVKTQRISGTERYKMDATLIASSQEGPETEIGTVESDYIDSNSEQITVLTFSLDEDLYINSGDRIKLDVKAKAESGSIELSLIYGGVEYSDSFFEIPLPVYDPSFKKSPVICTADAPTYPNNTYIVNSASLVTLTVPPLAKLGDFIEIIDAGGGGKFKIFSSSPTIHFLADSGDEFESTQDRTSTILKCTEVDGYSATAFTIVSVCGEIVPSV